MERKYVLIGLALYSFVALVLLPFVIGVPVDLMFGSDAIGYSTGAKNLLLQGFYSFDGTTAFMDREPGMSFFLVPIYFFFGVENAVAFAGVQLVLFFLAAWAFCSQIGRSSGERVAVITFFLLLTSGSVFHTIFSAYRECLALILLLFFSALYLSLEKRSGYWKYILMGLLFGALILTYYPFLFFPPALLIVWWREKRPVREAAIIILVCYALVSLWALRNFSYDGHFRVIDDRRTAVMWYVRGEQSEKVQGLEPVRCLYAEYISRNWEGLSPACSFNALMHEKWPHGYDPTIDYSGVTRESQAKILRHPVSYLWFSLVDILELHIPYVGGGWSGTYNKFAALTALLMYAGFVLGLPTLARRENILWLLLIGYNTAIFALTDATPRYLLPVIFCYALLAGFGYHRTLVRLKKSS